jgi:hypothetical protein
MYIYIVHGFVPRDRLICPSCSAPWRYCSHLGPEMAGKHRKKQNALVKLILFPNWRFNCGISNTYIYILYILLYYIIYILQYIDIRYIYILYLCIDIYRKMSDSIWPPVDPSIWWRSTCLIEASTRLRQPDFVQSFWGWSWIIDLIYTDYNEVTICY